MMLSKLRKAVRIRWRRYRRSRPRRPIKFGWMDGVCLLAVLLILPTAALSIWSISQPPSKYGEIAIGDFHRIAVKARGREDSWASDLQDAKNSYYQATSVHWAKVSALTAIASTLFSVIGMGLVLVTLRESRRQTRAAIDAQRAWIRIKTFKVKSINLTSKDGKIDAGVSCEVEIENIGQTPALHCSYSLLCWLVPERDGYDSDVQRQYAKTIISRNNSNRAGKAVFPGQVLSPGQGVLEGAGQSALMGAGSASTKHFPHDLRIETDEYFHILVAIVASYQISSGQECMTLETHAVYSGGVFRTSQAGSRFFNSLRMSQIDNISYAD